jgi:hypothetical protein
MGVFRRRWKMVSFRLPTGEYAERLALCHLAGYRNMSSFALSALRAFRPSAGAPQVSPSEATEIMRRVEELSTDFKRLVESLNDHNGS